MHRGNAVTNFKIYRFPRVFDRRLTWAVAGVLPLLVFGIVMLIMFTRQQDQAVERLLREAAAGAAHLVDRAVGEQIGIMNGMAASLAFDRGELDTIRAEARRLWDMHPEWRTVIVTDEHRPLLNLRFAEGEPIPALRDPISLAYVWSTGRHSVGDLVSDHVGLRVPVVRLDRAVYTIAVPVDPRFFLDILLKHRLNRPWAAAVVGRDHTVITATPGSPLKPGQPLTVSLAQDAGGFSAAGADYLAWMPVGQSGWSVLIVAPAAEVEKPFAQVRTALVAGGALSAALTALLVLVLSSAWASRREAVRLRSEITEREQAQQALRESEERFRRIAENAYEGIWTLDSEQRVTFANRRMAEILGGTIEEMIGRPAADFVHEQDLADHRSMMEERSRGERSHYERRMRHRDGTLVWALISAVPISDADGRFAGSFGMFTDITARKADDEAMRESEERFRLTFDASPDAININRLEDGLFVDVNQGFTALTGWQREEVLGRTSLAINIWHDPADRRRLIDRLNATGACENLQAQFRRKDGTLTAALMSARVISLKGVRHIVSITRDISNRVRAEAALRESEERYRQVVDHTPSAISILVDGRFAFVNPSGQALLGAAGAGEICGRLIWDFCRPEQVAAGKARYRQCEQEGRALPPTEFDLVLPDGRIRTIESSALPITHKDRPAVLAVWHDITERKQADDALKQSEANFRLLAENAPEAIFIQVRGSFAYANPAALRLFGVASADCLLGRPLTERVHPEFRAAVVERTRILNEERAPVPSMEQVYITLDGNRVDVEVSAAPFRFQGEDGALVFVRDVSARRRAETALRENEELFRGTFDFSPVGQTMFDLDYRYLRCNEAFCRFLGYPEAELAGRSLFEFTHPDDRDARSVIRDLLTGKSDRARFQKRYIHKDGNVVWGDVTVRLVLSPEGTPRHMLSVVQDATDKVRDAEQKATLEAQLRQAQKMEALGTLAGGIAHDFNNILGVIIGGSEMLELTDAMRESSKDILANVLAAAQRAKDLVKQILAFSRHTKQEKILLNLKSIIKETIEFMRASLPSTVQLRHFIDPAAGAIVADPTQMQQVLMNLCTNAAHAMERDGGTLQIRLTNVTLDAAGVRFDPDLQPGRYVRLTVADTGHGIDAAVIQRIFEPYFTTKEKGKGTGLGLAVVHGILKAHNGAITVASEPGRGTTFEVFLPRAEGYEKAPDTGTAPPLPTGTERILLVDDEEALLETERKILGLLGYHVEAASGPLEAIAAFEAAPHDFDLVLTDMTMPQMTGMKMACRMMGLRPGIPVIICTGFSDRIDQQQAQAAGIKALLTKPLLARELAEAIRGALKR
jgi:PAS domain S-box-containing protein